MAKPGAVVQVGRNLPAAGPSHRGSDGATRALDPNQIATLAAHRQGVATGFTGPWFPPSNPMSPEAPESTRGRAFDYPFGVNLNYTPRQETGFPNVGFPMLRRLAEPAAGGLDMLRIAIETRKDQMKAQRFSITGRDENDDGGAPARTMEAVLRKPDGINLWRQWLGMLLEDHFVIDAVGLYQRRTPTGVVMEQIDGATLKLLVDDNGRRPMPPFPAYQQVLKGIPAVDYTDDELGYYMYNPRPARIYGMSRVEQILTTISISLNRQLSVLNYFTAGSVPDMLIGVPETWQPRQIAQFQQWWDSVLSGNLAARRRARFFPGGTKPFETKTNLLDTAMEEWLARVICYAFSLPYQPFVKEVNKATSETSKESAIEEGLEPTKLFVKDVVDDQMARAGFPQLELRWDDEEIVDAETKAKVIVSYFGGATGGGMPIITLAEAREAAGYPPPTADQIAELQPPEPDPPLTIGGGGPNDAPNTTAESPALNIGGSSANDAPNTKIAKAARRGGGRSLPALRRARTLRAKVERGIRTLAGKALRRQRVALVKALRDTTKLAKVSSDELTVLLRELADLPWDDATKERLQALIASLASTMSRSALDQVGDYMAGTDDSFLAALRQANTDAVSWAEDRVGNLITEITETSQNAINDLTATAIRDGLTNDELADRIAAGYDFSDARATMIARTETATAESQGALIGYKESGVVTALEWDPDAEACPICEENAGAGAIPLGETFPSGDDAPPAHPNCECALIPVIDEGVFDGFTSEG